MPTPAPFTFDLRSREIGAWYGTDKRGKANRVVRCMLCDKPGIEERRRGNLLVIHVASNEGREQSCFFGKPEAVAAIAEKYNARQTEKPTGPIGVCGRCKLLIEGPIETRHNGHCGTCEAAIFGNPTKCPQCGASFEPQPSPVRGGSRG